MCFFVGTADFVTGAGLVFQCRLYTMPKNPVNMENTERQKMAHEPEMLWPTILIHFYCLALSLHTGHKTKLPQTAK